MRHLAGEDTPPLQEISEQIFREREERGREKEDREGGTRGER